MTENVALTQAQMTALGIGIARPDTLTEIFATIRVEDFDHPYRAIAEAIAGLRSARADITSLSVTDELSRRGTLGRVGGPAKVLELGQWAFGDPGYAIDVIARVSKLRRLAQLGARLTHEADTPDAEPHAIANLARTSAQAIIDQIEVEGDITTPTLGEFLDVEDAPFDWVIPGLLERGNRLILTGSEGLGKSVLQRQLAVATAAGVHPFTHRPIPPQRVLYVDCENPPKLLRRHLRPLRTVALQNGTDPAEQMFLEAIPAGLNLTKPEDELWLVRLVSLLQPALLVIGPIYRLHEANPNEEEPARKVTAVLDRCRAAANCAVITEAHAGHGYGGEKRPIRPTGTSLWLRWPEFGYGMRATEDYDPHNRVVDFVPWRGDRDERDWPTQLEMGGAWPWRAVTQTWTPTSALGA